MNGFEQTMVVKRFDLDADKMVAVMHVRDAAELGVLPLDRVEVYCGKSGKKVTTVVDITNSMVNQNEIGLFAELVDTLGIRGKEQVKVRAIPQPASVQFIRKKMQGKELAKEEIEAIIQDIAENKLSEIEASAFITAVYIRGNTINEIVFTTQALAKGGQKLDFKDKIIVDKHSIGGINGRTSMIMVPIMAANGFWIPKTASRSITSAAGTADSMEVIAKVDFNLNQIKSIVEKTGGIIAWGGAVDLAPGDDKIIKIEHPLSLDPEGQVIASVLAKKYCVGAKFVVIDIPVGPETKIKTPRAGKILGQKFEFVGQKMGMKVKVILTNGRDPACNVYGAALEAKNALEILEGKEFGYLGKKACELAGQLFEMIGHVKKGKGFEHAKKILESGKALEKMKEIIRAQGGTIFSSEQIVIGKLKKEWVSPSAGVVKELHVKRLANVSRQAGSPMDKGAGVIIKVKKGDHISKGQALLEVYSNNSLKLDLAIKYADAIQPIKIL